MQEKPNVLLILTDQQRYDTIGYAGNPHMLTPNLDRLAQEGCLYANAHSTNPVCVPARHDLLTGLSGRAHGYFANASKPIKDYSLPTLPRIFAENGYRTAAIGKMHFFPTRMHHGYGEMFLMEELPKRRQDDAYASWLEQSGLGHLQNIHGVRPHVYHIPQNSQMDEPHHGTAWVADQTIDWLKTNKDQPFLVCASWIHPHPPWDIPEEYQGLYKDRELPDPVPFSRGYPISKEPSVWFGDTDSEQAKRKIREAYYSAITMVDRHIGRVLDYLHESGKLDQTLIIFTSDHGEMLQDKGLYSKELPYDGSVRVPFIVRYPEKFPQGAIREEFVDLFDIFPTCLDVCGLSYTGDSSRLPGDSLCAAESPKRDRGHQASASGMRERRWVMYRNRRYKYVYRYNQGTEELYDLQQDPGETVNLLLTGAYPQDVYDELKQGAITYEAERGPEGCIVDSRWTVIDGKPYHPNAHSKYPMWANSQVQNFDDRPNEMRGAQFTREIEHALANFERSGIALNEGNSEPEWKEAFLNTWQKFGSGTDIAGKLFKERK